MIVKWFRAVMLLALLGTVACNAAKTPKESVSAASSTPQGAPVTPWPPESVSVRLVDTTATEEYSALKVEVRTPGRIDTIVGVLTFDRPVITADGLLHGPTYTMDGDYRGIYTYNTRSRQVSHAPLPDDAMRWDSEVKLSPDGTHIAYLGSDSAGSRGIVRTWPAGIIVLSTKSAPPPASDFSFNAVRWENPDSVKFSWRIARYSAINEGRYEGTAFVLTGGSLTKGPSVLDTLDHQPRLAP